jgi:hypothetical protein
MEGHTVGVDLNLLIELGKIGLIVFKALGDVLSVVAGN